MWQKSILLCLVEAMYLVKEKNSQPFIRRSTGHDLSDVFDTGGDRGKHYETRTAVRSHQPRQRRLAGTRRPPQHHGMHLTTFKALVKTASW